MAPKKKPPGKSAPSPPKSPQPSTSGLRQTPKKTHRPAAVEESSDSSSSRTGQLTPPPKKVKQSNKSPQPSTSGLGRSSAQKRKHPSARASESSDEEGNYSQRAKESQSEVAPKQRKRRGRVEEVRFGPKVYRVTGKVMNEIATLQKSTKHLIPKLSFARVCREVLQDVGFRRDMRVQYEALDALQTASEMYLVELFEDCCYLTMHARRITCNCRDIQLALRLRHRT